MDRILAALLLLVLTAALACRVLGGVALHAEPVDPFMGYLWSDWRLADQTSGNSDSANAPAHYQMPPILQSVEDLTCGQVLYCEATEADRLCTILADLKVPIILVTGRYHVPSFVVSNPLQIAEHPCIYRWFAQNPTIVHPKVTAMPYGMQPENLPTFMKVYALHQKTIVDHRPVEVLHAGLKDNYPLRCNITPVPPPRAALMPTQDARVSTEQFYRQLLTAQSVIAPCGDRCDTFRHVEAILLGCVPLTSLPPGYDCYNGAVVNLSQDDLEACAQSRRIPKKTVLPRLSSAVRNRFLKTHWQAKFLDARGECRAS